MHVGGYLEGRISVKGGRHPIIIVRQEDLLHRPEQVVEELARLGLQRNNEKFHPFEDHILQDLQHQEHGQTRNSIKERDARAHRAKRWCVGDLDFIRAELAKEAPLLDRLGYKLP